MSLDSKLASSRKKPQFELAKSLALGGQTTHKYTRSQKAKPISSNFKAEVSCILLTNTGLMDVTQLLRWLGLGGQTVKNFVELRANVNLISTKVSASHRKSTQVHANWPNRVASKAPAKQSKHANATYRPIIERNMSRTLSHPIARCWANNTQHVAALRNAVTQHVAPNNVGICCVGILPSVWPGLKRTCVYLRTRLTWA